MNTTRFDTLAKSMATRSSRRSLVKGLAALGLGGSLLHSTYERIAALPRWGIGECGECPDGWVCQKSSKFGPHCVPRLDGISGGGLVRSDTGEGAHLSLLATRTPVSGDTDEFSIHGQIRWADPTWAGSVGLHVGDSQVTGYWWTEGVDSGRSVTGWMDVGVVEPAVPFLLHAVDGGEAGSGRDSVRLLVGDAIPDEVMGVATPSSPSDFSYTFEGRLESGNLSLVKPIPDSGEAMPATPTP